VNSVTAAGQYSVNASTGVYTFFSADASAAVLISYSYTTTAGATYQNNNQVQGYSPQIELYAVEDYSKAQNASGSPSVVHLYACKIGKVTFPYKRTDYKMVDIEGQYFASANGRVVDFYAANG
jgi:hypothetical protein